ncbi:MAG: hypothetical protein IJV85_00315 [Clostridia bacterium]|nr:hypothetical protein [Clostridia bacterium]
MFSKTPLCEWLLHYNNAMLMARGTMTATNNVVDCYWGDFKLVDKQDNEIPLSSLK